MINTNFYPFTALIDNDSDYLMGCYSFAERISFGKNHPFTITERNAIDIVKNNASRIAAEVATKQATEEIVELQNSNQIIHAYNIFVEEGATLENCTLNASEGPIYIAKGCKIMDGAILRGPIFIDENSVIKMGATIYGGTSIGKHCVVGGEVKNSIINNYSNKAHHGYLGDSIIGKWCNLGAGTSNSNVKNNGSDVVVKLENEEINAGNKFGLLMGDYSRSAINTSFNTGTVVGTCCNIFAEGLTSKFIPHFSWGCNGEKYQLPKAFTDIENWKKMKGEILSDNEKEILKQLYSNL
jgi:UDP-N-acetylglucosamine diphosphorylase / glucose-1-phosphate thymidylyltransferase / UDP-N-acetylgalactosamine diphosphorylase / glucosamine-1-phosphate N-acetyltransferase / galactosamine-1-phosphate N-acetyltransferase